MLKFIIFIILLMPFYFNFWLIQSMMFLLCMLLMFSNYGFNYTMMSYFFSIDLISLGFIILSIRISCLMVMASFMI